jgi:uncharacterized protein (DUF2225 family)
MDFSALNKNAAKSFNQQKSLIKNVLAGKDIQCPICSETFNVKRIDTGFSLKCKNNCTDINLDADLLK